MQIPNVPKDKDNRLPLRYDHILRAQLPRCILEQGRRAQVRV